MDSLNPNKRALIQARIEQEKAKIAIYREKCGSDLFKFNKYILQAEKGKDSFVPLGEVHKEMCHFVTDNRNKKKLLLIPRNHLKTKLVSAGYPTMKIVNDPKIRILIYSATWQMAVDIISQIQKNLSGNEIIKSIWGDLSENPKEWAQDRVRLKESDKREPTVTAAGIENNLVGAHYDLIIFDDVVSRDNITTADQIQKIIRRYNDSLDLLEPEGEIIVIGTRWHDADLYGWILDPSSNVKDQYEIFIRRAYEGNLDTGDDFKLLWPGKFTLKDLQTKRNSQGWSHFSSQYLNDPVPEEDATFKKSWFQYYESPDLRGKLFSKFMVIDPAISEEKYADFTAMVVAGVDEFNFIYILDIVRERLNPNALINEIFKMRSKFDLKDIALEQVVFQKTIAYTLREEMRKRGEYFHITEVKPNMRSKDERIKGLQPLYENGKIIHNKLLRNNYYLEDELLRYPRSKHDDIIDAMAYLPDIIFPAKQREGRKMTRRPYLY